MNINGIDVTDKKILEIIQNNARLSYSEIGSILGISRVAVKNHMDAMEKQGIIKGYKTVIDSSNVPGGLAFLLDLEVVPEEFNNVVSRLSSNSLIRKIYSVSGEGRIHAEGIGTNKTLIDKFSTSVYNMKGIKKLGFYMVLDTLKDVDSVE